MIVLKQMERTLTHQGGSVEMATPVCFLVHQVTDSETGKHMILLLGMLFERAVKFQG